MTNVGTEITNPLISQSKSSDSIYKILVDISPNLIILIDHDAIIIECNIKVEECFNLSKQQILNSNYFELFKIDIAKMGLTKRFSENLTLPLEVHHIDPYENIVYYENSFSEFKIRGNNYILIEAQDITIRKNFNTIIQNKMSNLEEINKKKSQMFLNASHEIITPLNSVVGACSLLLNSESFKLKDKVLYLLNLIKTGGERLEELIKILLDFSQIEAGNFELVKKPHNIKYIVLNCINDVFYLIKERRLEFRQNKLCDIHLDLDKTRIEQVIRNLLSNAIKNTPPPGFVEIYVNELNTHVEINVKDSGVGITSEENSKLFKKFGKIERKNMNVKTNGIGLGLFLSKKIIEKHNGNITVSSKGRNQGSTFTIHLPKNQFSTSSINSLNSLNLKGFKK